MRFGPAILAVCVIGACGGSASSPVDSDGGAASSTSSSSGGSSSGATSSSGGSSSGDPGDGGAPKDAAREANVAECPAAFSNPGPDGHCKVGVTCAYDEGSCACLGYCGGVAPPDDVDFSHWSCTPKRTDGCPDDKPMTGASCNSPGKFCDYGDCCIEQLTCTAGQWKSGGLSCPP